MFDFLFKDGGEGDLFDWAGEGIFGLIGGAAAGAASYYAQKEKARADEKMYERRQADFEKRHMASTVGVDKYDQNYKTLTGGMLTNGILTGPQNQ